MKWLSSAAVLLALTLPARAESCLTTGSTTLLPVITSVTPTTSPVLTSAALATTTATVPAQGTGGFFLVPIIQHVASNNPAGFTNAQAVTGATLTTTNAPAVTGVATTNALAVGSVNVNSGNAPSALGCGSTAKAGGDGAVAVGPIANAQGKGAVAVGAGATAPASNSVALGAGSIAGQPNTVSVGTPNNTRRITNVSDGVAPNDAVNVSQLVGATSNLQQQINASRKEYRAGISMAMAAAALQTGAGASGPGKVAIGMAGGAFGGTASLSAGIAYSPVKQLNFNAGVSVAPDAGMVGVFGGAVYTLN